MSFQQADRFPYWEPLGFEPETIRRWHREGLPPDVALEQFFQWDRWELVPIRLQAIPPAQEIPLPVDSAETLNALTMHYSNESPIRYPYHWEDCRRCWAGRDYPLGVKVRGFARWLARWLGEPAAADPAQPLAQQALDFLGQYLPLTLARAAEELELDFVILDDDLCPQGAALSRQAFAALAPYYRQLVEVFAGSGAVAFILDSRREGSADRQQDISGLAPALLDAGINALMPCPAAAGMDALRLSAEYEGRLRLVGGLDARALQKDKRDADREARLKVPVALERGGWIPSFDAPVPPNVPLANYERYWQVVREYTEPAAAC